MFIPFIPNTTIVNKTIVYSDTVLNFKELGNNLNVTSISGVGEYSFQSCLETIFKSNPNVIFNTIQYSKNNNKIYFYTDNPISTKEWEDKNITKNTYSNVNVEVLKDLKDLFANQQRGGMDTISIYDVMSLSMKNYYVQENIKQKYKVLMNQKIKNEIGNDYAIVIHDFDYDLNELFISIIDCYIYNDKSLNNSPSEEYKFQKKDGDLYISEAEHEHHEDDMLPLIGDDLSNLYDLFLKSKDYNEQAKRRINPINSGFLVDINRFGVNLYIPKNFIQNEFSIRLFNGSDDYSYECNSNNVMNLLKGNEDELFKKIFVRIDDCPEWMRSTLYEQRQVQLAEEQKEDEKKAKREKRKELVRKVLPFI
jgi:hypothetical protein